MYRYLHTICKSLITLVLSVRLIAVLPIIIIGAVIVLCGVVSCSDEVDLNKKLQEYIYEPGLTSGQKLKISLNLDSLVKQIDETRIYTTENIDSVMILLSNKTTSIYNPSNHIAKYRRMSRTSPWEFERPLYLGDITANVGAYAPDTASLVYPTCDSIWAYIDTNFDVSIADTLQVDYLYGTVKNKTENLDGTPGSLYDKEKADFEHSVVGITMNHALAKLRIHVCNLAYKDTAKHNGVRYMTYTGTGDVNHVYFCGKPNQMNFFTKTYMSVTGKKMLRDKVDGVTFAVDTLHWGVFDATSTEAPQNVCDELDNTKGDTALYTALICPGRYNTPYVGVVLDGVGRYVQVYDGAKTFDKGKEYDVYVTVCNSSAGRLVILDAYVVEWMDARDPQTLSMANQVDYFTDLVPINWDSAHNVVWGKMEIDEYGDTLKYYEYSSRQPFMYDDNGKLIYAYSDCVSPGHVHTGDARLQWAYPTNNYTFSDGRIIKHIVSEDKVYIYKNSTATRPSCVLYNTILYDGTNVVYDYLSTSKSFTWLYPTDVYTSPDGSKFIHRYDIGTGKHYVYFYDKSGLYYEISY